MPAADVITVAPAAGGQASGEDAGPITTEVGRQGLIAVADQMKLALQRTAFSPIIYDMIDFACGLFDRDVKLLAQCDVRFADKADNKTIYTDFRPVLERKDIDIVAIGTHPGWHALISIAAMEAGKDVLCEKPMTRFIAEGRAVVEAEKRYGRIYQVGTYGRFEPTVRSTSSWPAA